MAASTHLSISSALPLQYPTFHLTTNRKKKKPPFTTINASSSSPPPPTSIADALTAAGKLLWGRSLPPQLLVSTARSSWTFAWRLMMKQLAPSDPAGAYSRPVSAFPLPTPSVPPPRRLHLYAALPCPWAHRTLIVRAIKRLHRAVPLSLASPGSDGSWQFPDPAGDRACGRRTLKEVYKLRPGGYDGRATVPMLWNVEKGDVFCNESYCIAEFFNSALPSESLDLSPPELKEKIEYWNRIIYPSVNNGVYRCGFAQTQEAYEIAVNKLFKTLDMLEEHLGNCRYLCGDALTLADICLFTTLIRFDLVYHGLFKCSKKKLIEYPNLHAYTRDIYQIPNVAETCDLEAIMDGYYKILFPLNPGSIRPVMPSGCEHEALSKAHNREWLTLASNSSVIT